MTEYTITIANYETGLAEPAVEDVFKSVVVGQGGEVEVSVEKES